MKKLLTVLVIQLSFAYPVCPQRKTDRERDGYIGLVKSVHIEMARLSNKDGKWVEGPAFMIGGDGDYNRKGWGPWGRSPKGGGYGTSNDGGHGEFIFDDQGNKTTVVHYSNDNQVAGQDYYKYDNSGNELEQKRYDADGKLMEMTIHMYDINGKRIEEALYSGDGNLREKRLYRNEKGNVIEEMVFDSSGLKERRTFAYELDSVGNWIKRTSYLEVTRNGEISFDPEIVTRRKITYY